MSTYQTILYAVDHGVATLTLNRPDRRNAITQELLSELLQAFTQAGDDPDVRAVVLTGAGKGFCSGQDLSAFAGNTSGEQVRRSVLDYYKPLIMRMVTLPKPIIGAINGAAAGAGASLALACDLRILAEDAYLMQAFSNIGLVPDAGSSWFLVRLVGYSRALEIAIEAERLSAHRCLELGLANRVTTAESLLSDAQSWAQHLAQRPTFAIGLTKQAMVQATEQNLETLIEVEAELQAKAVMSYDHKEGVTAFIEKRKPVFQGR
ncbi:MAG: enoyl-CoA hydratase-related protein [Caldilineaceae bacterium]